MTPSPAGTPRKVKKTPTEIIPEVKLQEPRHHKKYERNSEKFGLGMVSRIIVMTGLILGAFILGIYMGFGEYTASPAVYIDPMIEHCKLMPEMSGCEEYNSGIIVTQKHDMLDMSMRDMGKMLEGKTGDALDKAFLEGMIPHHEGAVEMVKYLTHSNHIELKKMGEAIIKAQTKEIEDMKKWQIDWGYIVPPTPADKIAL